MLDFKMIGHLGLATVGMSLLASSAVAQRPLPPPVCQRFESYVSKTVSYSLGGWGGAGADNHAAAVTLSVYDDVAYPQIKQASPGATIRNFEIVNYTLELFPEKQNGRAEFTGIHFSTRIDQRPEARSRELTVRPAFYASGRDHGWIGTVTFRALTYFDACIGDEVPPVMPPPGAVPYPYPHGTPGAPYPPGGPLPAPYPHGSPPPPGTFPFPHGGPPSPRPPRWDDHRGQRGQRGAPRDEQPGRQRRGPNDEEPRYHRDWL